MHVLLKASEWNKILSIGNDYHTTWPDGLRMLFGFRLITCSQLWCSVSITDSLSCQVILFSIGCDTVISGNCLDFYNHTRRGTTSKNHCNKRGAWICTPYITDYTVYFNAVCISAVHHLELTLVS